MPRTQKQKKPPGEDAKTRRLNNRHAIERARGALSLSPLGPLLELVAVSEGMVSDSPPFIGAVDTAGEVVYVNADHARKDKSLPVEAWTSLIGHLLLHLALNHAARGIGRDPLLWNAACDEVCDRLLAALQIGTPTYRSDGIIANGDESEDTLYERLVTQRENKSLGELWTLAGKNRPDILGIENGASYRSDWEAAFATGIRRAAEEAVEKAALAQDENSSADGERKDTWPPAERAKRWVLSEFPLLGALAGEVKIIANAELCERMDIPIAAVNGFLGEMYLHPRCGFTDDEMRFVYVHELLHVALLHHSRVAGRDPLVWNIAADFVINGWLIEMNVGKMPAIGGLYDPRLQGLSAEQVYDMLIRNPRELKNARGFRGKLGDVLLDTPGRVILKNDVTTMDDVYRKCLGAGLSVQMGRGYVPAGLLEEIKSLFTPPVPWDVELARWMDQHVPILKDFRRTYARASRRQSSTPDIPRAARYLPQEVVDACTFGVVLDTSGSMDRELLGRALGAIASYADARDVPAVRLVLCDAQPYDRGMVEPQDLRGVFAVQGRGGTVLQPAVSHLLSRPDFPPNAPVMIITDGWCEEEILCAREHCFLLPRKSWKEGAIPLRTSAPIFRVLKYSHEE